MNMSRSRVPAALAVSALGAALALTGCSSSDTPDDGRLQVLASFYPLQFITQEIGGDLVDVSSLTPSGAEPHDLELSPAAARGVGEADLVVYLSDFQPAVDDAIAQREPAHVVDAADSADLEAHELQGEEGDEHEGEEHSADDGHDHGALDPHFWLDPERLAAVSADVVAELSAIDPDNADTYAQRGDELAASLTELDTTFTEGLAQCDSQLLVTSHEAFGYLADRYGLVQEGITGINPDTEPSPKRLREVRTIVERDDVSTLFFERAVGPKVTQTLADDLGVGTALLDPIESRADESADYLDIMRANLDSLTTGLTCG